MVTQRLVPLVQQACQDKIQQGKKGCHSTGKASTTRYRHSRNLHIP